MKKILYTSKSGSHEELLGKRPAIKPILTPENIIGN